MSSRSLSAYITIAAPYLAPALFLLILPVTHTVALRLLLLLIITIMAAAAFTKGDRSRPPCLVPWALWFCAALLSLITAVEPGYSLGEIKTELGYGILAFLSFYVLTRSWRDMVILTATMLVGFWILGGAGLYDSLVLGVWQNEKFYDGVGGFSSYQVTLLPLLLLLAYRQGSRHPALTGIVSLLTGLLFLLTAYKTMNLAVWISLSLQVVALLLLGIRGRTKYKAIIGAAFLGLSIGLVLTVGMQKSRISSLTPEGIAPLVTQDPRIQHWGNVTDIISQQPFRGSGFGRAALNKDHPGVTSNGNLWHSHNIFLDAAVQMGLQGLLAFLLLFGCLAWRFDRYKREPDSDLHAIGVVGLVLLVGILSKSITDNFFYRHLSLMFWSEIGMLFGLARGLLLGARRQSSLGPKSESSPTDS